MQLNSVVLPAPLGPMIPTISHSPTVTVMLVSAWIPPKRMATPRVSSTDIGHHHLPRPLWGAWGAMAKQSGAGPPNRDKLFSSTDIGHHHLPRTAIVDVEAATAQPLCDGPDRLAHAAR